MSTKKVVMLSKLWKKGGNPPKKKGVSSEVVFVEPSFEGFSRLSPAERKRLEGEQYKEFRKLGRKIRRFEGKLGFIK